MKAYKFCGLLLGATVVLTPSCSQQEETPVLGAEQTVTFTAQLPGRFTRSAGDGTKANNLKCFVYDSNGVFIESHVGNMSNAQGAVSMRLASGMDYKLVFWADTKLTDSPYSITDAGILTVDYTKMTSNDDAMDAFYLSTTYHAGNSTSESVILKRPFAQVNFGTDDLNLDVVKKGYGNNVRTTVALEAYTEMDLVSGKASKPISLTTNVGSHRDLTSERFPAGQGATAADDQYSYLNMGYVLVPTAGTTGTITLNSYNVDPQTGADPLWTIKVPNAPLRPNYRTNIFGSLLTTSTNFQVTITPTFDGSSVATVAELKKAAQNGGAIIVSKPIDMKGETIVVENGKTLDVNLNGNKISNTAIIVNGSLNIDGDGEISAPTNAVDEPIIKVVEGGNLTLTDGTFEKGVTRSTRSEVKPCVEVLGGTATISGGVYRNEANGVAYTPVKAAGGKLIINGGRFYKADPRNFAEFGASASVLPATAEVYTKDNYYCVLDITKVSTAEELIAAEAIVKEGKFEITVTKDITIRDGASQSGEYTAGLIFNSPNTILNINPGVTLTLGADANGSIANMNSYYGILSPAGKNLTINNNGLIHSNTRGVRAYGNVTINGGNFKAYHPTKAPILWVEEDASAVLNNVRFVANCYCIGSCGNVTINGGYFEGHATNKRGPYSYAIYNDWITAKLVINNAEVVGVQGAVGASKGSTEINGGYYHTHPSAPGDNDNFYALSMVGAFQAKVVINGGNFYSEPNAANHGACINWQPYEEVDPEYFVDTKSTLEIKGGKFSSKGFYGLNSAWEAKPFVDNYLTPAAGYKWESINEELYKWQVVKDDSAPATASAPKKAKTRAAAPKLYRRLNTGGSR